MADSLVKQSLKELMRELAAGSEDLFERFTRSSGKGGIATGTDFEPEEQQLFLRYIGKEVARLKLKEKELRLIKSMMPTTDLRVYTIMSPADPECPTQDEDTLLRHEFCSKWRYVSYATQYESFSGRRYTIEWDHEFLGAESPHDPLVLFSSKKMLPKTPHGGEPTTRISSQLLLYRVCALFGMPLSEGRRSRDDDCWSAYLRYRPRPGVQGNPLGHSFIGLTDVDGDVSIWFGGFSDEASLAAVDLINALLQPEYYHEWHGDYHNRYLAGRNKIVCAARFRNG
ncbi:hypothetical protein EG328_011192 [Venturia inaequalis]|uniref:Uncharacterized protein n=1 Tax=Venturia inaequalis TaxID=5025 RepID=A0A8H3VJ66_VENIN|nr:hypothetical protein EG328_011192 [Venturia inaequalis]